MLRVGMLACVLAVSGGRLAAQAPAAQPPGAPQMVAPFPDVPPGHWAFDAVEKLRQAGIIIGYPQGTFGNVPAPRPKSNRAETVPFDHWAYDAVQRFVGEMGPALRPAK